jgi:catechol 2,3-dioxygenase-like lactoylglutathione lyase family enzyme
MTHDTAVQFATISRIHMALAVQDLEQSVAFYSTLFGQGPTKIRPHYARFEVAEPPVNLSLNEVGGATGPANPVAHFGIQVKSTAAVQAMARYLTGAGLDPRTEEQVACCYAVQDKVWVTDPDGNAWEVYVVLKDDAAQYHSTDCNCCPECDAAQEAAGASACGCSTPATT